MYNVITVPELIVWFLIAATEFTMYAETAKDNKITIFCELFTLAGFHMQPAAEAVGIATCFVIRLLFGINAMLIAIVVLTVQLALSTALLKYFITLD